MAIVKIPTGEELVVSLQTKEEGDSRVLAREQVTYSDLHLARDETHLHGMRAGLLGPDMAALGMHVWPGENRGTNKLAGYTIELRDGERSYRQQFPLASLEAVARRALPRLIEGGQLGENDSFHYSLTTLPSEGDDGPPPACGVKAAQRPLSLAFEPGALADYLQRSEPLTGLAPLPGESTAMPVFVTAEVWEESRQLARRGGEQESAAVWTGRLLRDQASPELFLVLDACIEAEFATEEKYAVTFSGDTWATVRSVLEQRRRRLNRPQERIVGSVHGHNFLPAADANGRRTCDLCHLASTTVCSRTTAVASAADLTWHRSVFTGQPWALLCVWGWNAREQEDWTLYGLANATLTPRPIRMLKS